MQVDAETRPAVRGGPSSDDGERAPVPVRSGNADKEEEDGMAAMEVEAETVPAPSQPPREQRSTRKTMGGEESSKVPPQ